MITVKVRNLTELQKKLDGKFLIQPEVMVVRDKFTDRVNRKRKTAGYQNNPLEIERMEMGANGGPIARIGTPLNSPRRTGSAWKKFVYSLVNGAFMRNQLNSAAKKIAARFAS